MGMIHESQIQQFHNEGYMLLPNVLPAETLEMLRAECQRYMNNINQEMDQLGVDVLGLNHRGKRYFIHSRYQDSPEMTAFIFGDLMADIVRTTVGDEAYFFLDQFVVKMAEVGMKFSWHQDAGYIDDMPAPYYVTHWIALDDVNEANGTVYILPYSEAGTRERIEHTIDPETNDRVGYHGDKPGIPAIFPAGSMAIFTGTTLHRSGPNTTDKMRRGLLLQYSAQPILNPDGSIRRWAEPFLKDGENIFQQPA